MDLGAFRALLTDEGQALLAALQDLGPAVDPATVAELRRRHSAELVSAAIEQVRLRREAVAKFGADAERMYFTRHGLEEASHLAVTEYKLGRVLHEISVVLIDVLGLGIGAEAIVLSWSHDTSAVDGDPLDFEVTAANREALGAQALLSLSREDVMTYGVQNEAVFIDLLRRGSRGAGLDPESYVPPLSWALDTVRELGAGAVRLAPDLPHEAVPGLGGADEAEWISHAGEIQEAVLWFGLLGDRPPSPVVVRRATLLPEGATLTSRELPAPAVRPVGRYLYEPDGAVIRARLLAELAQDVAGGLLDEAGACLTSEELHSTPFATVHEITDVLPFAGGGVQRLLRERAIGRLTVREYGCGVEAEELRGESTVVGPHSAVVFLVRVAGVVTALFVRPGGGGVGS